MNDLISIFLLNYPEIRFLPCLSWCGNLGKEGLDFQSFPYQQEIKQLSFLDHHRSQRLYEPFPLYGNHCHQRSETDVNCIPDSGSTHLNQQRVEVLQVDWEMLFLFCRT